MIYWLILVAIILFQFHQRKENIFYLNLAFYFFLLGAFLRVITLNGISEIFMRTSFILFAIGLVLSYWKNLKKYD